jgi:D-amino peptidase
MSTKIYVITDLEGVGGVASPSQVFPGNAGYEKAREWLTLEVNAAVEGALEGGATDILVLDGHGANSAVNMVYEKLHEGARYIQGAPWRDYLQSLDDTFTGLFQIGAHAMAGTPAAVLEHTMSSESWVEMLINGKPMGEIGLCAAGAGRLGVPFIMVSGDDKACEESRALSPGIECAVVKYGISRQSAEMLPMPEVHSRIREKARLAVQRAGSIEPLKLESPVEIQITYLRNSNVDSIREREGVRKVDGRTVAYTGRDVIEAFHRVMGG